MPVTVRAGRSPPRKRHGYGAAESSSQTMRVRSRLWYPGSRWWYPSSWPYYATRTAPIRERSRASSRPDPVLAGNVLKVVNSPLMRVRSRDIESLEQAVTMLGSRGMREVIAAATISPLANFGRDSRLNEEILGQVWPETLQTAVNGKLGAEVLDLPDHGFALYMAGLAHSSGLLVLLRGLDRLETREVSSGFVTELECWQTPSRLPGSTASASVARWRPGPASPSGTRCPATRRTGRPDPRLV